MSAHPFQSWPTFREYCDWLVSQNGQAVPKDTVWGATIKLVAPDGNRFVNVVLDSDEQIGPEQLEYIETRLDVASPWTPSFDGKPK